MILGALALAPAAGEAAVVVATIKPIHSLVAGVMEGAGAPVLLVRGAASPHAYALRPSGARALRRARLVFRVGGGLEASLEKPLKILSRPGALITLSKTRGLILRRARSGGAWEGGADHGNGGGGGQPAEAGDLRADMHIWLDPVNARSLTFAIAGELGRADKARAPLYRANAEKMARRIGALSAEIRAGLGPVARVPYVVFHDAYRYFEARFGLRAVGAVAVSPGRRPGAKRLTLIRRRIRALRAACVFAEPQFSPALIETVAEGTGARVGVLDPLGADLAPGAGMYFALMRGLAASLRECLAPGGGG